MGAYDDTAEVYLASGLWPIPVRGKSLPVDGATGYRGTVTDAKIAAWLDPDRRSAAGRGAQVDNIGLRHQGTLAIDVDQGYGDKDGVAQLAAYADLHGLGPLPATWSSTARGDDSPSRQYVYRISEDVKFKTKPCKSVELCTWHHRFTVCAPSIHPGTGSTYAWYVPGQDGVPPTWGERTDRYPLLRAFAELPAEWFVALQGGAANADMAAEVAALPELLATFPAGEPDGLVQYLIEKWSDPSQHVGHDEAKGAFIHAFMLGREGHPGVEQLLTVLWDRLVAYLLEARPDQPTEAHKLIAACSDIAQRKPLSGGRTLTVRSPLAVGTAEESQSAGEAPHARAGATDDEVSMFLDTYVRYARPDRLGRRTAWMRNDRPSRLPYHARCLVRGALEGDYPAQRVLDAIAGTYRHHGGTDPQGPLRTLSIALGAILNNAKVSA